MNSRRRGCKACLRRLGVSPTQMGLRALVGAVLTAGSFLANQFAATRTQSLPAQAGSRPHAGGALVVAPNEREAPLQRGWGTKHGGRSSFLANEFAATRTQSLPAQASFLNKEIASLQVNAYGERGSSVFTWRELPDGKHRRSLPGHALWIHKHTASWPWKYQTE
jgi:hypothetical protein